jgi:hypothetical protein
MKFGKLLYILIRIFNYILGISGALLVLGAVGGYENYQLTFGQFILYEILAFAMIFATYIVYNIRVNFKNYFIKD